MADLAGGAVLLVEDEPAIADNVIFALRGEGLAVEWRTLGSEAVALLSRKAFDLVILDVGLPDGSGFERCKEIRAFSQVPIVFLTARSDEVDRVVGFEIGGDDYVTKPFSPRELAARVKSILRRSRAARKQPDAPASSFIVDEERARIAYRGSVLALTRYEYLLLKFLAAHPERVYSRAQLLDQVWARRKPVSSGPSMPTSRTLRAKLHAVAPDRDPIATHRGLGYSLSEEP
jgi:two-component system catabolic regulation response regulator CreB